MGGLVMEQVAQATQRALKLNKGFTLIELLVVIAIIAILASLAIPQYLAYQRKARVSSYAEPIARACMLDIAAFCGENPNQQVNTSNLANCRNTSVQTAGGNVTLSFTNLPGNCTDDGQPPQNATVTANLSTSSGYIAECTYQNASVRCTVK